MSETLQRLVLTIETQLATIDETYQGNENLIWSPRQRAYRSLVDELVIQERAKYSFAGGTYLLTLAGIRTSCTAGDHGLLRAWLRKAKAEIDGRRAA
jgi:hypothetical protein